MNGTAFRAIPGTSTIALYRNNRDGTFTDVTQKTGLAVEMYGMGVAIGDFDNDGYDDIFITALGQNHVPQQRQWHVYDVTRRPGCGAERIQHQRCVGGLRPRRAPGPGGGKLREVVAGNGHLLRAGWKKKIVLHAGSLTKAPRCVCGTIAATALLKTRRQKAGLLRFDVEEPGRGDPRRESRRLAGYSDQQRHGAEQTVHQ